MFYCEALYLALKKNKLKSNGLFWVLGFYLDVKKKDIFFVLNGWGLIFYSIFFLSDHFRRNLTGKMKKVQRENEIEDMC